MKYLGMRMILFLNVKVAVRSKYMNENKSEKKNYFFNIIYIFDNNKSKSNIKPRYNV